MNFGPWERRKLPGYFDTNGLEAGDELQVLITLHFGDGQTTEETAVLRFVKTINYFLYIAVIAGIIAVIVFVVWVVLKLKKLEKKNGKKKF